MLRRNVDTHGTVYGCSLLGVTLFGHPVVIVTSSKEPLADFARCAIPSNWEWMSRA